LVLPPYKKQGHGSKLYQTIYEIFRSRKEICEITVEDPNEEFSDMRDKNDIRYLLEHEAFKGLKSPVSAEKIDELCARFKLTNRQTQRCIEMYLLSNINKLNADEYKAYRLQVKKRLYSFNFVSISSMCLIAASDTDPLGRFFLGCAERNGRIRKKRETSCYLFRRRRRLSQTFRDYLNRDIIIVMYFLIILKKAYNGGISNMG
jgi:hypothetical protein